MMEPIWFFLPAIVLLGTVTSYTDIKKGKIRNRHILLAILYVPIAYSAIILLNYFTGIPTNFLYLQDMGINMLIAAMFGFAAWHFRIWSAADGKLFIAYAGLVPLTAYSNTYYAYFPSFTLLINTFFPVFVFLAAKSLLSSTRGQKIGYLRNIKKDQIIGLVLSVFWLSWIIRLLMLAVRIYLGFAANILIILSLVLFFRRKLNLIFSAPLCLLRLVFDSQYIVTMPFILDFSMLLVIALSMFFIITFSNNLFTRHVEIKNLKPGMIPSESIMIEGGIYKKIDDGEASFNKRFLSKNLLQIGKSAEGLTEKEIENLKYLEKKKKLDFSGIKIAQTLPFSPFLFLGALLTIIAGGDFLLSIVGLFK